MSVFHTRHNPFWMIIAGIVLAANGGIQVAIGDQTVGIASLAVGALCVVMGVVKRRRKTPDTEPGLATDSRWQAWVVAVVLLTVAAGALYFFFFQGSFLPDTADNRPLSAAEIAEWQAANPPKLRLVVALDPESDTPPSEALLAEIETILGRYLAALEQHHPPLRRPGGEIELQLAEPGPLTMEDLYRMIHGGYLTFHLVHPESETFSPAETAPPGYRWLDAETTPLLVETLPVLDGTAIAAAGVSFFEDRTDVSIGLNLAGSRRYSEITAANIGRRLAFVSGGRVLSAPHIREQIAYGNLLINGGFAQAEAQTLARALGAGGLPAPLVVLSEEVISP